MMADREGLSHRCHRFRRVRTPRPRSSPPATEVRCLVRDGDRATALLDRRGVDPAAYELVVGDMTDVDRVAELVNGGDATIHAAAAIGMTGRGGSIFESNTVGAGNVLVGAMLAGHDPIVHVSSVAVFVPPREPVITPESPLVVAGHRVRPVQGRIGATGAAAPGRRGRR